MKTKITVTVSGTIARAVVTDGPITSGMVGVPVIFSFDEGWDGLRKKAVYQAGSVAKVGNAELVDTDTVPWEVLETPGQLLKIGVEGRNEEGTVVIPTVWAACATILTGARAGEAGEAPSQTEMDQLWAKVEAALGSYIADVAEIVGGDA